MALTVDSLQVEITASAEQAEKAIDSLINSLGQLSSSMKQVDAKSLTKSAKSMTDTFGKFSLKISGLGNATRKMSNHFSHANGSLSKTHGSLKSVVSELRHYKTNTDNASKSTSEFASKVGMLYVRFLLLMRGIKSLWKSIKSSMDYIETLNYFDASFNSVAESAVKNFRQAGYDSAEAYYGSFADRAKQLTAKMTGWNINGDGTLSATGLSSLGLNPTTTMQYQAQFAQMANSMGVASETALRLSQALTEIGADLASVKNMEFDEVWQDMASGMVGMSRTLDKYGVNIRNANLQTKLTQLGIDATVSSLSQADKAMLRTIILLESTKYAWGDLAETLNSPANQLRLLTNNFKMLCQLIGNLFLPLVMKVLPLLNAMVIALQRITVAIANFFGVDLSKITSSVSESNDAISDILDEADDLDDALDDASDSAKKLKNNLLGVDELNIVSDNVDTNTALDNLGATAQLTDALADAMDEYQKAWDEAFKNLENKAQELADKIMAWFNKLIAPIKKAWQEVGEQVVEAWKNAFKSIGDLLQSIGRDFWKVWGEDATTDIFKNIFLILADIGKIVDALATNFKKAWDENNRGYEILKNIRDIFLGLSNIAKEVADYAVEWAENLDFVPILESIRILTETIAKNSENIFGIVGDLFKTFLDFGKYLIENFYPNLLLIISSVIDRIDWEKLRENLNTIFKAIEKIAEVVGGLLLKGLEKLGDWIVEFVNGGYIDRLADAFTKLADTLANAETLGEVINGIFDFGDFAVESVVEAFNGIVRKINEFIDTLNTIDPNTGEKPIKTIAKRFAGLINTAFSSWDAKSSGQMVNGLAQTFLDCIITALAKVDWFKIGMKIGDFLAQIEWGKIILKILVIIGEVLGGLIQSWLGSFLKAPIETGILTAIGMLVLTKHALAFATKFALALAGQSVLAKMTTAFSGLFKSGAEAGATKGVAEAGAGVKKAVETGIKSGGWFAGIGTAISTVIAGTISAGIGTSIGNELNKAISESKGEETYDWTGSAKNIVDIWTAVKDEWSILAKNDTPWYQELGEYIVHGIGGGIVAICATALYPFTALFNWVVNGVKNIFGIHSPARNVMFLGEFIMLGIIEGFTSKIEEWYTAIQTVFGNLVTWFDALVVSPLKSVFQTCWEAIKSWTDSTKALVSDWKTAITDMFKEFYDATKKKIENWFDETKKKFESWKDSVIDTFNLWKQTVETKVSEWVDNIKLAIDTWKTDVENLFTLWRENIENIVETWKANIERKVEEWKTNLEKLFNEWKANVEKTISLWKQKVESLFEEFKEKVKGIIKEWKETIEKWFDEFKNNVGEIIRQFKEDAEAKFNEFKDNVIEIVRQLKDDIENKFNEFKDHAIETIKQFKEDAESKFDEFKENVCNLIQELKEDALTKINEFKENAKETLFKFIDETADKFEEWKNAIVSKINETKTKALDALMTLASSAKSVVVAMVTDINNAFSDLIKNMSNIFDSSRWTFSGVKEGLTRTFDNAFTSVKNAWNDFFGNSRNSNSGFSWETAKNYIMKGRYSGGYATGGFPTSGSLFIANEAGAEMVGSIGGHTAVANNDQIVQAVSQGVYNAVVSANNENNLNTSLLQELIGAVRAGQTITIDGREIVTAYDERKARNGFAF